MKKYISILLVLSGGFMMTHWWRSILDPHGKSNLPEFFISHFLLVLGICFLVQRIRHGRRIAIIFGLGFVIYGFFMSALLIPGGIEESGIFAFVIPIYLIALGVMLGVVSFLKRK